MSTQVTEFCETPTARWISGSAGATMVWETA